MTAALQEIVVAGGPSAGSAPAPLVVDARLPMFVGLAESPAPMLGQLKVAVVGAGSIGRRIALAWARLGVQELWLIDPGRFDDPSNLVTQEILRADVCGEFKAARTGGACKGISPATRIRVHNGRFQDLDAMDFAGIDYCMLATDNLAVEVDAARAFVSLAVPVVQASVHGETLTAQVRFTANRDGAGPCLACAFGQAEWQHLHRETVYSCNGPSGQPEQQTLAQPTISTGFLCSMAADLALVQCVRHALHLGQPVDDTMLQYCGFTHQLRVMPLERNPGCPCEHVALRRIAVPRLLEDCPLGQLSRRAGYWAGEAPTADSFTVGGFDYVESAICCQGSQPVERLVAHGAKTGCCPACSGPLTPQPFFTHPVVPAALVLDRIDAPLRELGAKRVRWVVIRGPLDPVLVTPEVSSDGIE